MTSVATTAVHVLYKEGQIRRAVWVRGGGNAVYIRWLGGLKDPEELWERVYSREEHLAEPAMRETLAYALNIDDFRQLLGFCPEDANDEKLLKSLQRRAQSAHMPASAKVGSEKRLNEHGGAEKIGRQALPA